MRILIGNANPIVGHKQEDGTILVEELPEGEYTTEVIVVANPEDILNQLVGILTLHVKAGKSPIWVQSEDQDTTDAIAKYYGIKDNKRPDHWGESKEVQVEKVTDGE